MKLKRQPEDFQVEELPTVSGGDHGRFGFYRLTKRGIGSLEAIEAIRRRWNLSGRQIGYGGLKDKHAVTVQYLTIFEGPDRGLREHSFDLEPIGRLVRPYGPDQFRGNRFTVVLRDLSASAVEKARKALGELPTTGCRTTSTTRGSARSASMATSSRGPGWRATTSGPSGWRSPSPTPPIAPTPGPRRRSSASPGATGPRPRPGSPDPLRGAW